MEELKNKEIGIWKVVRYLAAVIINISGKSVKKDIKPESLVKLEGDKAPVKGSAFKILRNLAKKEN